MTYAGQDKNCSANERWVISIILFFLNNKFTAIRRAAYSMYYILNRNIAFLVKC